MLRQLLSERLSFQGIKSFALGMFVTAIAAALLFASDLTPIAKMQGGDLSDEAEARRALARHRKVRLKLGPQSSKSFMVPIVDSPVRLEVATTNIVWDGRKGCSGIEVKEVFFNSDANQWAVTGRQLGAYAGCTANGVQTVLAGLRFDPNGVITVYNNVCGAPETCQVSYEVIVSMWF